MHPNKYTHTTRQSNKYSLAGPRRCCVHCTRCCYGQTTVLCQALGTCINCDHSTCLYDAHREWAWYAPVLAYVIGGHAPKQVAHTIRQSSMYSLARSRMCCVHWTRCCYGQTTVPCHASGICINCDHSPCLYDAHREWTWYARVLACVIGTQKNRSREARSGRRQSRVLGPRTQKNANCMPRSLTPACCGLWLNMRHN